MKKRLYLAVLAVCVAAAAAGCSGKETVTEKAAEAQDEPETGSEEETQPEGEVQSEEEAQPEEEAAAEEDTEQKTEEAAVEYGDRLVSVDNVDKYVTIADYKGLALDNTVQQVSEEAVDTEITYQLKEKAEEVSDANAAVEEGDIVTIDYVGTKDGEAFEGGTASNSELTIGEGGYIDGFEDGIIGMKKGETRDVNLTFPEDYFEESLAGQPVVFKITLQKFSRVPELTDEWAAANTASATAEEYRQSVREMLQQYAEASARSNLLNTAWETVFSGSEVKEYPEDDVNNAVSEYRRVLQEYADQADMELEEFVESQNTTMEVFEEQCQQYSEYKVKQNLIVQGIMDAEGMRLDDEESLAIRDRLVSEYGCTSPEQLAEQFGQASVNEAVALVRVEEFIVANAEISEKVDANGTIAENADTGGDETEVIGGADGPADVYVSSDAGDTAAEGVSGGTDPLMEEESQEDPTEFVGDPAEGEEQDGDLEGAEEESSSGEEDFA